MYYTAVGILHFLVGTPAVEDILSVVGGILFAVEDILSAVEDILSATVGTLDCEEGTRQVGTSLDDVVGFAEKDRSAGEKDILETH